jgi:hypothetical protein
VLKAGVGIVCEMEACTELLSVHCKQCAMIEFLTADEMSPTEIHCQMKIVHVDDCVDVSTLLHWAEKM